MVMRIWTTGQQPQNIGLMVAFALTTADDCDNPGYSLAKNYMPLSALRPSHFESAVFSMVDACGPHMLFYAGWGQNLMFRHCRNVLIHVTTKSCRFIRELFFSNEKKRAQRRRKHCALVSGAKNFRPAADPLPGGAGRPKCNQLTYKSSLVRIDARNFELSW